MFRPGSSCSSACTDRRFRLSADARGSKRAGVEHHGFEIYRYMAALRDAGLEFVGMSSVGPSIAVITDRPEGEMAEILETAGLRIAIATTVDNEGLKVQERAGNLSQKISP